MFLNKLFTKKSGSPKAEQSYDEEKILSDCRVAILATDGFEQVELFDPRKALLDAGAQVFMVAPKKGSIKGWNFDRWGKSIDVDLTIKEALETDFDFLLIPGGVLNPDKLRLDKDAVTFVKTFVNARKTIASICHGPQLLIETGMVKGRTLTSFPSIKTDLINAGANWVNEEVVVSHGLITSRKPDDLRVFNNTMIKEFGYHRPRPALPDTEGYVVTL